MSVGIAIDRGDDDVPRSKHQTLGQCWQRWYNVRTTLGNVGATLDQRLVFAGLDL